MKYLHTQTLAALALTFTCGLALADGRSSYSDHARVLHAEPVYRYVTIRKPHRVCTPIRHQRHHSPGQRNHRQIHRQTHRQAHRQNHRSNGAVFVGGAVKGAIGREVTKPINGSNTGRTAANDTERRQRPTDRSYLRHVPNTRYDAHQPRHNQHRSGQRCTTTTHTSREKRIDGYDVTYVYNGHKFHTRTLHHPGHHIGIRISLAPQ